MQDQHLFEYAVIRLVPKVEREEFLNIGVILLCTPQKFLQCMVTIDSGRIKTLWAETDLDVVSTHVQSFERICIGGKDAGPIGQLTLPERFRWLTASRSTMIQTSKVHPGLCSDAQRTLERLRQEHVANA
ncbi:MAG: DUF3037 domain-containing protein [Chryseolinea sp.]